MATWHTIESARDEWPDAPSDYGDGGDNTLASLLAVAKEAVLAYAPATVPVVAPAEGYGYGHGPYGDAQDDPSPTEIPDGWRLAQLKAARNSWNDTKQSREGFVDGGELVQVSFEPWHQHVRPKTGKPWIG